MAQKLGRKGTESDIAIYNFKSGDNVLSFVDPISHPEKIQGLLCAINMADQALLYIDELNPRIAEVILALDCAGLERGYVILAEEILDSAKKAFKGTVVEGYEMLNPQIADIRQKLSEFTLNPQGDTMVLIDHSFTVKGAGTIALGTVKTGSLKKHDTLHSSPKTGSLTVKSIQVHDRDVSCAFAGVRVGLCIKDAKPQDIPRGTVLSKTSTSPISTIQGEVFSQKFSKMPIKEGDNIMANSFMGFSPAKVIKGYIEPGNSSEAVIELEKPLSGLSSNVLLLAPGVKPPRVFGRINVVA